MNAVSHNLTDVMSSQTGPLTLVFSHGPSSSRSLCEGIFAQEADGADSLQWEFLQVTSLCHRDNGKCVVY